LLDTYVSHKLSENFAHAFVGLVMLVPAFFLVLLVAWVLDKLFIDVVDEEQLAARSAQAAAVIRRRKPAGGAVGGGSGGAALGTAGHATPGRARESGPVGVIPPPKNLRGS
jgi:hypothetical protein